MSETKKDNFLRASTILFFLNISASALNYLCQLLMARLLSVESYGTINTIFSFMMIVAVPGTTLTMVVAKHYASYDGTNDRVYLRRQLKVVIVLTLISLCILVAVKPLLAKFLDIDDIVVLAFMFLLASLGFFQPLYSGVFSGCKKFILVGIYSMIIPIYKIVAIGVANFNTDKDKQRLYITLFVMLIGTVITALLGHYLATKILKRTSDSAKKLGKLYSKNDIQVLVLNISLMLYMNVDLLSVRYYGNTRESGLYSAVLLFGRIIYYFATTLGTVLLPSVADNELSAKQRMKTLNKSLILMIAFTCLCMIPINAFKDFFIRILYGKDYFDARDYVFIVTAISLALSICTILVNYVVGVGKTQKAMFVMLLVDGVIMLFFMVLKDVMHILKGIATVGLVGAIVMYFLIYKIMYSKSKMSERSE